MNQSAFYIAKMDCPIEEQIIRNRLKGVAGIQRLDFNLMGRVLTVHHTLDNTTPIQTALDSLGIKARYREGLLNQVSVLSASQRLGKTTKLFSMRQ